MEPIHIGTTLLGILLMGIAAVRMREYGFCDELAWNRWLLPIGAVIIIGSIMKYDVHSIEDLVYLFGPFLLLVLVLWGLSEIICHSKDETWLRDDIEQ